MCRILLWLLLAGVSGWAQEIVFVPQDVSRIPGLKEYRVFIKHDTPVTVQGMDVMLAAVHQSLRPLLPVNLQNYVNELNKRSPLHVVEIVVEVVGYITQSGIVLERIKIKEQWINDCIAAVPPGLTLARTIWGRESPAVTIPIDAMRSPISVAPTIPAEFAVWAL